MLNFRPPPGECKISEATVTAKNMIPGSILTKTFQVGVICPIVDLTVESQPSITKAMATHTIQIGSNQDIKVTVKIRQGSMVVYRIDKGDGTFDKANHIDKLYPQEVTFILNYPTVKVYHVNVTLENPISSAYYAFDVQVKNCPIELLEITGSPEAANPTFIARGSDYKVTGQIIPSQNCSGNEAIVTYAIEFYNIETNSLLKSEDLNKDNLIFNIPKLSQPAGRYRIDFIQNATTADGPVVNIKNAYVTIKQTPLLATIESGSSRSIPLKKKLQESDNTTSYYQFSLDGSPSYDPDDRTSVLTYEWYCRATGPRAVNSTVCNRTDFEPYRQAEWQSKIPVHTSEFTIDVTFEFLLKVKHKSRMSNYSQLITFLAGSPPAVEFE